MSEQRLWAAIREVTAGAKTVLDVGAGTRRLQAHFHPDVHRVTSIDGYAPDLLNPAVPVRGPLVLGYLEDVVPTLADRAFDVVLALDVIEHLPGNAADLLIEELWRVTDGTLGLFVPEGYHPQEGTPENPLQAHRSTWHAPDLERRGFTVTRWPDFHAGSPGKDAGAMWAVRHRGVFTPAVRF